MDSEVIQKLLAVNQEFYQTFALQFSQTRQRLQPGVRTILKRLPAQSAVLDIGCGNGWLWHELNASGWDGMYTGIDSSPGLIEIASSQAAQPAEPGASKPARGPRARFILADLAAPSWTDILFTELAAAHLKPSFDVILCLAVLHHLPGQSLRLQTLQKARHLQEGIPDAWLCLSAWQFLNSPRWQRRIQPWHSAGIEASQVEEGDYLLDWRHGGTGLRYVHLFQPDELAELAIQSGYRVQETFLADGENERLGLYQVWRAV